MTEKTKKEETTTGITKVEETNISLDNFKTLGDIQRTLNQHQLAFIKSTVAKDVKTNEHVFMLVYKAMMIGADLLRGEMIGYTDSKGNLVTISTKDFMLRRAYQTGDVEKIVQEAIYVREGEVLTPVEGKEPITTKTRVKCQFWETGATLVGAYTLVKRFDKEPVEVTVPLKEYSKDNAIWRQIPETMIKKVSLVQGLRLAFPNELGGVYDADELDLNSYGGKNNPKVLVEDGDAPADENQIKTIEAMGGDASEISTKQQAVDMINQLKTAQIKGKGKKK